MSSAGPTGCTDGTYDAMDLGDADPATLRKEEVATDTLFTLLGTIIFSFSFSLSFLSGSRSFASDLAERLLATLLREAGQGRTGQGRVGWGEVIERVRKARRH